VSRKQILVPDWKAFLLYAGLLSAFWLLMAPYYDLVYTVLGILLAVLITAFWQRELFPPESKLRLRPRQVIGLIFYLSHLLWNVILASLIVARIVLSRRPPIYPGFILLQTKLKGNMSRVLYANSITLTPGTISIDLQGDRLLIHSLTKQGARGVFNWYMEDMLRKIELNGP